MCEGPPPRPGGGPPPRPGGGPPPRPGAGPPPRSLSAGGGLTPAAAAMAAGVCVYLLSFIFFRLFSFTLKNNLN